MLHAADVRAFETRKAELPDGRQCFMWEGDAGFAESDPVAPGARFRMLGTVAVNREASPPGSGPQPPGSITFELEQSI